MAEMPDRGRLKFDELILRTVVRVLNEVLGEAGASFLFGYLSRHGDLERERIPGELGTWRGRGYRGNSASSARRSSRCSAPGA